MKKLLWFVVILAVGYFIFTRFFGSGQNPMGMMPGGAMPVTTAAAIEKEVTLWDEYSGRLTAVDNVEVRPRVAGMVESVHFEDGQIVKKGDLLFIIDPRPYRAAFSAAQATYNMAAAEFERAKPLLAEQAISQRNYEARQNAVVVARSNLTQAKLNLEYTEVAAPVAGKVGRREVTPGNLVTVGMPVLTTIVSQSPIYADFEADEQRFLGYVGTAGSDAAKIADIPVILEQASGVTHQGHVQSFDNQIDVASGTIRVRAVFDNADGTLVPGMFARLKMGGVSTKAVLISDHAVSTDQDKKFVYVVGEDNKATYREVKLGPLAEGLRVVQEGLAPGEAIIVSGLHRIQQPGTPVTPTQVPMEDADKPAPPPQAPPADTQEKPK